MKKVTATLIAGLFATAAFAQTPAAPASAVAQADGKDAKTAVLVDSKEVKADAKEAKDAAKAESKDAKASADVKAGTHGADVSATAKTK